MINFRHSFKSMLAIDAILHTAWYDVTNPEPYQLGEFDTDGQLMPVLWSN